MTYYIVRLIYSGFSEYYAGSLKTPELVTTSNPSLASRFNKEDDAVIIGEQMTLLYTEIHNYRVHKVERKA